MAEFILNPRRAPRAPARCRAAVISTQGWFEAETEDIGAMGCQLVSPKLVRKGDLVQLRVTNPKLDEPLKATGRVAWVSPQAPWRVGIAFDEATHPQSARWFDRLVAAYPGLGGYRRVPDRIRADASVYLGPPPRFLVDFTADEAALLRAVASGARVDELRSRLRDRWPALQRALFSLIARQAVTFQRGQAVHPDSWKKVLSDVEASLAVEQMGKEAPPLVSAVPPPPEVEVYRPARGAARSPGHGDDGWGAVPHDPSPVYDLAAEDAPPLDVAAPGAAPPWNAPAQPAPRAAAPPPPPPRATAPVATPVPAADFAGAGVGWRRHGARSAEAQAAFDDALEHLRSGSVHDAIALLRKALQLAPGDPEIAQALGKLAFKDRPGSG